MTSSEDDYIIAMYWWHFSMQQNYLHRSIKWLLICCTKIWNSAYFNCCEYKAKQKLVILNVLCCSDRKLKWRNAVLMVKWTNFTSSLLYHKIWTVQQIMNWLVKMTVCMKRFLENPNHSKCRWLQQFTSCTSYACSSFFAKK